MASAPTPTIQEVLTAAADVLRKAGVPSPEADADRLLRHVLGWDRARLLAEVRASLPQGAQAALEPLVRARASRRPLQHLVGTQAFWKHDFLVSPDVLIPRPETEILVEESLRVLAGRERPTLVDVGTGSGCIALSLAAERQDAAVHATDLSSSALAVARANARRLGLEERVRFHEGDLIEPLAATGVLQGCLDLVVSNPPYVDPADRASLAPEVRDHEPALALFPPGKDPYSVYRRLVPAAAQKLGPGGYLVLEVGLGMADVVGGLAGASGFSVEDIRRDLQGIPRAVVARRLPAPVNSPG